jgi:hypothetical protein
MGKIKGKDLLRILVIVLVIIAAIGSLIISALSRQPDVFLGTMGSIVFALFFSYIIALWNDD